ncbi:hypothetical protein [Pseudooceanicola spongiae]|jgi:hypothetical protein|uniref:Uncharacterized protein n=1 Tax=Pseudooceanicola spongiae TaxID=2613965 RepID=A0A7L9WQB9_9RHOB|nr:hypothetical protein [Pseudooceanicola spongiae]QOL82449.1 hypothetical protein F3W81_17415 [Pseudooceanicola spongiae]
MTTPAKRSLRRGLSVMTLLAMASLAAGPAQALSCLAPDVARSFDEAAQSDARYMVLLGTLDRGTPTVPERDLSNNSPEVVRLPALVKGLAMTEKGFSSGVEAQITMELGCTGPWCAQLPENGTVLAFIELTNNGPILRVNACGGHLFANPTKEQVARLESCQIDGCPVEDGAVGDSPAATPEIAPEVTPESDTK